MADIARDIDEIRSFMDSNELSPPERVQQAAASYSVTCQEANRRLGRCTELLHKGLRSQAIHEAQTEPALMDLVAQLDFPDIDRWLAVCSSYGMLAPPRLQWKFAEELNQAYAQEKPLEDLMKRHRLLALRRAGMSQRVPVLRKIAELDSLNPIWDDDIRAYEKVRIQELSQDFQAALKANDDGRIAILQQEIIATGWREPIPQALAAKIADQAAKAHHYELTRLFGKLEIELNEAVATKNLRSGRECRARIENLVDNVRLSPRDPLLDDLQPGLDELARLEMAESRRKEHDNALDDLRDGLRQRIPFFQLREKYETLDRLGEEIPYEDEDDYRDRQRADRRARKLKRVLVTVAVLAIVAGSVIGGVVWMSNRSHEKKVAESRTKIDSLLEAKSYGEARFYIEDLTRREPKIADAIDSRATLRKLDEIDEGAKNRSRGFADALRKAKELPIGDPFEQSTISNLNRLASSPSEKADADEYAVRRNAHRKKEEDRIKALGDGEFQRSLAALEIQLQSVRTITYDRNLQIASRSGLATINRELVVLESRAALDGLIQKQAAEALRKKVDEADRTLAISERESGAISTVSRALPKTAEDLLKYQNALADAAKAFQSEPRQKAFKASVAECIALQSVFTWNEFLASAETDYLLAKDAAAAEKRSKQLADWSKNAADELAREGCPVSKRLVDDYAGCLKAASQRSACFLELRALFSREDVQGLHHLRTTADRVYYINQDLTDRVKEIQNQGGSGFLRFRQVGGTADTGIKFQEYKSHGPAPQSEVADKVLKYLRLAEDVGTEELAIKIVGEHVLTRKDLDSILTVIFIKRTLEAAAKADAALAKEVEQPLKLIADATNSGVDLSVPWIDPKRVDAAKARAAAAKFLADFPTLKSIPEAVAKRRKDLEKQLKESRHQVAGWLYNDPETGWKMATALSLPTSEVQKNLKIVMFDGDAPAGWKIIGSITKGKPTLTDQARTSFAEGRLVFVHVD